MKSWIHRKFVLALGCDIALFLSVVLVFVLKAGPLKSLLVAAPMGVLFILSELIERPAGAGSDLTDGERRWRFSFDVAGCGFLAALIFYRAWRQNDVVAWHWAALELVILAALLMLLFSEAPLWGLRKPKLSRR